MGLEGTVGSSGPCLSTGAHVLYTQDIHTHTCTHNEEENKIEKRLSRASLSSITHQVGDIHGWGCLTLSTVFSEGYYLSLSAKLLAVQALLFPLPVVWCPIA